jgi:hypothetical protein
MENEMSEREQLTELQRTAPERIWLQISDDADHKDEPFPYGEEVTWCQDSVTSCQVEYVRADLARAAISACPVPADLKAAVSKIEDEVARGSMTAPMVFTKMRYLLALAAAPTAPAPAQPAEPAATGWPPGMLQDDSKQLSKWLASKPDAPLHAREAAAAIAQPAEPRGFDLASICDAVFKAAINCGHSISDKRITLNFDKGSPGHNALNQLHRRLYEAICAAIKEQS